MLTPVDAYTTRNGKGDDTANISIQAIVYTYGDRACETSSSAIWIVESVHRPVY